MGLLKRIISPYDTFSFRSAAQPDLADEGFDRLVAFFRTKGFVSDARRPMVTNRPERETASQAQVDMIVGRWRELSTDGSMIRFERWGAGPIPDSR
jgi:hypothetical protein